MSPRRPKISLCMTVRDEAAGLERCLASVEGLVDEIVVCDTGSEDASPEIAARHGARVLHRRWEGAFDFAEARNFVCDHARGDIAVFIDGDEHLADDARAVFRAEIEALRPGHAMTLAVHSYTDPARLIPELTVVNHIARVHWLQPRYRWVRPVHTQIFDTETGGTPPIQRSRVKVMHTGYLPRAWSAKRKAERLALLERLAAEEPHFPHSHQFLAQLHLVERRFEEAARHARRAIEVAGPDSRERAVLMAQNILLTALLHLGRAEEFRCAAAEALRRFPESGEARFNAAIAAYLAGDLDGAERRLRALRAHPEETLDQSILAWKVDYYLAKIALLRSEPAEALRHLEVCLRLTTDEPAVLLTAAEALALTGATGRARDHLSRLRHLDADPAAIDYVEALCRLAEGQNAEAIPLLRDLVRREFNLRSSLLYLGLAHQLLGEVGEAEGAFRAILARWPEDAGVRQALIRLLIGAGRGEEALAVWRGFAGESAPRRQSEALLRKARLLAG